MEERIITIEYNHSAENGLDLAIRLLKEFDVLHEIIEYDGRIEIKYSIDYVK